MNRGKSKPSSRLRRAAGRRGGRGVRVVVFVRERCVRTARAALVKSGAEMTEVFADIGVIRCRVDARRMHELSAAPGVELVVSEQHVYRSLSGL